ncbi:transposase [Bacillus dakarensis]|uniref:transposase n=1 Tax=Robertmurraya dakarensis TaxID=1926278 RepID=UPI0009819305|nr:transposase [Bacillus dakarensis]
MCNPKTTTADYNTQMILLPEVDEKSPPKRQLAPTFKPYDNRQIQSIFDIETLIQENHVARVVDEMVEAVPNDRLFSHYKGGGRSSFHPKMMLKIILFAYSQKVYSCRGIETLIKENIPAMWLAAMHQPDFRTINEFRGERMKVLMDELFEAMIIKLIEDKYITLENYFLDGTKIEANANKYSFVWKKATEKFEAKLREKIQETLQHIQELTQLEAGNEPKDDKQKTEVSESDLETAATELEEKIEALTEDIEKEPETNIRKVK